MKPQATKFPKFKDRRPFVERHPIIDAAVGCVLLLAMLGLCGIVLWLPQ